MVVYPNVKINLGLHILSKRPDGFHELETLFVPYFGMCDKLEIEPSDKASIELIGADWNPYKDLSWRAWELLRDECGCPPVSISLEKRSAVAAGLGGGSSDAAFTLIALNDLFGLGLGPGQLASLAARLGSDCPFFIYNRPMLARGCGEILEPFELDLAPYKLNLVLSPHIKISTKDAYSQIVPRDKWNSNSKQMPLSEALSHPIEDWKELLVNDFEPSIFAVHPELAQIKMQLYQDGAIYASMSGSGSAMFYLDKI